MRKTPVNELLTDLSPRAGGCGAEKMQHPAHDAVPSFQLMPPVVTRTDTDRE